MSVRDAVCVEGCVVCVVVCVGGVCVVRDGCVRVSQVCGW